VSSLNFSNPADVKTIAYLLIFAGFVISVLRGVCFLRA
jgi:hypothetical protein